MSKFFFDLACENQAKYDYKGRALPSSDAAREMAELIALDLAVESEGSWVGWRVEVSNAQGLKYFSVAVQQALMC